MGTLSHQLEDLESSKDTSVLLQGRIATNINALARHIEQLNNLKRQVHPSKRDLWNLFVSPSATHSHTTTNHLHRLEK